MKTRLQNYLVEFRRRFNIIFESRDLEIIRSDFYTQKWISKEEMRRLFVSEIEQVTQWALREREEKNSLLENFRLATMQSYYEAEEKLIKSGRIF
jgi:hypothetical protein